MSDRRDTEVFDAIQKEIERQEDGLELIASENFVSRAVLEAQGSALTNKYAEGYPGKRYYGGCQWVDVVEQLAIDRAKRLFGAEAANVQPHSGSQANMAAYFALAKPGDTLLALDLAQGGHLTHGAPVNFSGKLFKVVPYGLHKETERIDYEQLARLAQEHRPRIIVAGFSAYPRTLDYQAFRRAADSVGASLVVDMAHIAGLVAAGLSPSPIPYAEIVTTTTHKTLRGPRGGMILSRDSLAKTINSQIFPGIQGGPLMHVIAAKAVAFGEALEPEFKIYQKRILENAQALGELAGEGWAAPGLGRNGQPPAARRRAVRGSHREDRRRGAGEGRHHRQQEHDSLRSGEADGHERHSRRHARSHDARHGNRRDGGDRHSDCQGPQGARRRGRPGRGPAGRTRPGASLPAVRGAAEGLSEWPAGPREATHPTPGACGC